MLEGRIFKPHMFRIYTLLTRRNDPAIPAVATVYCRALPHVSRAFLLVLSLYGAGLIRAQDPNSTGITETQAKEDLNTLMVYLNTYHPDLDLYTSREDMAAAVTATDASLVAGVSVLNFYRMLAPLLPLIGNNHTKLLPPADYMDRIANGAPLFPFSLYARHDTVYVLEDALTPNHIWEGRIIDSIYYKPIGEHLQYFMQRISRDGMNRTLPLLHATKGFSRQWALHYGLPDSFRVVYQNERGKRGEAWVQGITVADFEASRAARGTMTTVSGPPFSFTVQEGTGIMVIKTFQPTSVKDYRRFLEASFQRMEDDSLTKLVLDLRGNLGGYPEASWALLAYLIPEPVHPTKTEYAIVSRMPEDHLLIEDGFFKHFRGQRLEERHGRFHVRGAADQVIRSKSPEFLGRLVVLMDASTSSTAGQLLGLLKAYTPAVFVGEEAGGNPVSVVANDLLTLVLPHSGLQVRIPVIKSEQNIPTEAFGHGILPDFSAKPSISAMLQEKDTVLQKALGLAAEKP